MPIEKFAEVTVEQPAKVKRRRFQDGVTMLVVGAEEGRILLHQTDNQSYTISGEMLVSELRDAGIDVEDWVARELIAPLGQLAERTVETDSAILYEDGEGAEDEDEDEDEEPQAHADPPLPEFNDTLEDDGFPTNPASAEVPDLDKAVVVRAKKAKKGR